MVDDRVGRSYLKSAVLAAFLTLPSEASMSRTGVSRTLATKQNVFGASREAEGYHSAALTESGWEMVRG